MLIRMSRWALRRRSRQVRWTVAAAAMAVALAVRLALDPVLPSGFPYVTFFPAVLIAAFVGGLRVGLAAAVAGALLSWYLFIPPVRSLALTGTAALALFLYVFVVGTQILLIEILRQALRRTEAAESEANGLAASRSLMFQELQHRVSNNLSVIGALLSMQRRQIADDTARRALEAASARLKVVAQLNRLLHDPTAQEVDLAGFLRAMAPDVIAAAGVGDRIAVEVAADSVRIGADRAVPIGLVATELLANAIEHGLPEPARGRIRIGLSVQGDSATLTIADDGAGLPDGFDLATAGSLGLSIARQFAVQVGGELTMTTEGGTRSRLTFPLAETGATPD